LLTQIRRSTAVMSPFHFRRGSPRQLNLTQYGCDYSRHLRPKFFQTRSVLT
jgi:hypothetical protein